MNGPHVPPGDVWIDERLVVRSSPIEARGLFAVRFIPAGTVVIRLGGLLVSSAELDALIAAVDSDPSDSYVDTITVNEDAHLVLPPDRAIHFGDHGCDPTLWHVGPYEIAARRDLRPGDEAYATQSGADGFVLTCNCGAAICRGQITSEDWRIPELQQRYNGHWVPALQHRIAHQ